MSVAEVSQERLRRNIAEALKDGAWHRLAEILGYETRRAVEIPEATYESWGWSREAAAPFDGIELLADQPGFRLILVVGDADYRAFRRLVCGLARRNVEDAALWWWDRGDTAMAATTERGVDDRMRVQTIEISRDAPESVALEAWSKLERSRVVQVDTADGGAAMQRHLSEAFAHRDITRSFFRAFSGALETLIDTLESGPRDEQARHELCLSALLRTVFVYFLQRRGMLDGDRAFVLRKLRAACSDGDNFTRSVLKPLFFGALNRPLAGRDALAARLGELPFLNGGLFEPLPVEQMHPDFTWPNHVWVEIIEGLFERYHFAVTEAQADDERSAVDPEMLGRVFEGLMYGSSRRTSGSFYTPRDVVRSMVERALAAYLCDRAGLSNDIGEAVVRGDGERLDDGSKEAVRDALGAVTILDPAVGTGAFLLEALHCLRRCWRAVGADGQRRGLETYHHVRDLIHRHLFGVDIQHTAVRLCELRLWLALLGTMPDLPTADVPPLPNLAHRVCAGNSLVSPLDIVQLKAGANKSDDRTWGLGEAREVSAAHRERASRLQDVWLTSHGDAKRTVRQQLEESERQMQLALLDARRAKLRAKLEPLERLASSEDLFGEDVELDAKQEAQASALRKQLEALEGARENIEAGRASGLAFSYAARFAAVLDRGGFDVVVTNPPWVRASRIDDSLKGVLKQRYASHANDLWRGASQLGIRAPFGAQTDLAALFLERSLELLRPGGHLCALVPSKLFRSLHGAGLRRQLMRHDLLRLEDHSDSGRKMFDATVYPAVLHARKAGGDRTPRRRRSSLSAREPRRPGGAGSVEVTTWRGRRSTTWSAPKHTLPAIEDAPGAPWLLVDRDVSTLIAAMREGSRPMGSIDALQPRRGLFTGRNDVFLTREEDARAEVDGDWQACTRRIARGRDCRAWRVDTSDLIWWGYDDRGSVRSEVPDSFRAYFERHRDVLEARGDYRPQRPLWQVFRVKPGLTQPKVLWRDLSPRLEAAFVGPDVVPLNTVYFVPFASVVHARIFEALLNSEPVRAVAYALGERARGGWRRHFSWVMRMLPVPDAVAQALGSDDGSTLLEPGELEVLSGQDAAAKQALADRLGARWFGLDTDDLRRLAEWREGGQEDAAEEVAA